MVEQFKILPNFLFSIFFKFDLIISIGIKALIFKDLIMLAKLVSKKAFVINVITRFII